VLRIGLTGGIGAGKSTVAAQFAARGVPVIDADVIAREVVEPGAPALDRLAERFGTAIRDESGELDRQALARIAFADAAGTRDLGAIMHPAIAARTRELYTAHAAEPIVVHDVPLLVENDLSPQYHLSILVDVPAELRLRRLVEQRGMDEDDARSRIARQADDEQRRTACDVVLDNSSTPEELRAAFADLFAGRIEPFAHNLQAGTPARNPRPATDRPLAAARLCQRIDYALADAQVPGTTAAENTALTGPLRLSLDTDAAAAELRPALAAAGFFPQTTTGAGEFSSADPGCAAVLSVRPDQRSR